MTQVACRAALPSTWPSLQCGCVSVWVQVDEKEVQELLVKMDADSNGVIDFKVRPAGFTPSVLVAPMGARQRALGPPSPYT